jgi:hypothetical protein
VPAGKFGCQLGRLLEVAFWHSRQTSPALAKPILRIDPPLKDADIASCKTRKWLLKRGATFCHPWQTDDSFLNAASFERDNLANPRISERKSTSGKL